jgi:O-antigen/teichoic acid export membrane protein
MSLTAPSGSASFRRLGRETAIYGLGVLLGRAVSFLMLPVYTRFLTPADYGIIQLLDLTVDVAAIFFTAGASSGVQRFYF